MYGIVRNDCTDIKLQRMHKCNTESHSRADTDKGNMTSSSSKSRDSKSNSSKTALSQAGSSQQAITNKTAVQVAVWAGIALLIFNVGQMFVQPAALSWMPQGFLTPILALEFLSDFDNARQLLAQTDTAERFTHMVQWDMAVLVGYGVFLVACVCAIFEKGMMRNIALIFAVIAPVADFVENVQLLKLLGFFPADPHYSGEGPIDFYYLRLAVVIKFGCIALANVRLMRPLLQRGPLERVIAGLMMVDVFATGASFYGMPYAIEVTLYTIVVGWLLLWMLMFFNLRAMR